MMARVPITDLPIRVFTPMDPNDKCIALIGTLPIRFTGDTPMKARKIADDWRKEQVAKRARLAAARKNQIDDGAEGASE